MLPYASIGWTWEADLLNQKQSAANVSQHLPAAAAWLPVVPSSSL